GKVTFLPWCTWREWIKQLNKFKLGINLMPTRAAGTFSMNCAMLGIPCIGFNDLDTQKNMQYSSLNVNKDLDYLRHILKLALTDSKFYERASTYAKKESEKYSIYEKSVELRDMIYKIY